MADKTSELYQKTYWASYNIPYVFLLHPPPRPVPAPHAGEGPFPGDFKPIATKPIPPASLVRKALAVLGYSRGT